MRVDTWHPKTFLRTRRDSSWIFTPHTTPPRSHRRILNPLIGEIIAIYRAEQEQATARKRFTSYSGRYWAPRIFDLDFRVRVSHQFATLSLHTVLRPACPELVAGTMVEALKANPERRAVRPEVEAQGADSS